MWVAVYLVTHTFDIAMAIFDVANHVVSNAGGMITGSASIDVTEALKTLLKRRLKIWESENYWGLVWKRCWSVYV